MILDNGSNTSRKEITLHNKFKEPQVKIYSCSKISSYAGGERLMLMILNYLLDRNYDATIIQNIGSRDISTVTESHVLEEASGKLVSQKFKKYGFVKFFYHYLPELDSICSDTNSISLIFIWRIPPISYLKRLSERGVRVVFCLHGIAVEKFRVSHPYIMAHQIFTRWQVSRLAKFARNSIYVQTLTNQVWVRLIDAGAERRNLIMIENAFEHSSMKVYRNDDEFQVIFIGRIENLQKGINRLRRITTILFGLEPAIRIKIIGTGKDAKSLEHMHPNAKYMGNLPDMEKLGELSHSNLMILTSNTEPYPRVLIEGLFSGLPIVTTPTSGPSHIISKHREFGVVSSFSAYRMAHDILKYYDLWKKSKEDYYEMKVRICKKAKEIFIEKVMLDSYTKMVDDILLSKT